MPDTADRRAAELLEEYMRAATEGRSLGVSQLLGRCPPAHREELREAIEAFDFLRGNWGPRLVSQSLVDRTRDRILADQTRREQLAQARARLAGHPRRGVLSVAALQDLLGAILGLPQGWASQDRLQTQDRPAWQFRGGPQARMSAQAMSRATREMAERAAALEASKAWRAMGAPDPPVDPSQLAEMLGLLVLSEDLLDCDGAIAVKDEFGAIVLNARVTNQGRRRFTFAHEIGHFQLHRAQLHFVGESLAEIESNWTSERELGANVFASELLMPRDLVDREFAHHEPSFSAIEKLAERYSVSVTAAARRLVTISDFACALVCVVRGRVKWFAASELFPWSLFMLVGNSPPADSDAASLLAGAEPRDAFWATPATWWCGESGASDEDEILEDSRPLYDQYVLTLLYARDVSV
jgi:Zn-dependent peptidase ImmA (M78 family)